MADTHAIRDWVHSIGELCQHDLQALEARHSRIQLSSISKRDSRECGCFDSISAFASSRTKFKVCFSNDNQGTAGEETYIINPDSH